MIAIVMTTASIKGKVIATSPTSRSLTSQSPTSPTCHVSSDRMHSHDILIAHFTSGRWLSWEILLEINIIDTHRTRECVKGQKRSRIICILSPLCPAADPGDFDAPSSSGGWMWKSTWWKNNQAPNSAKAHLPRSWFVGVEVDEQIVWVRLRHRQHKEREKEKRWKRKKHLLRFGFFLKFWLLSVF